MSGTAPQETPQETRTFVDQLAGLPQKFDLTHLEQLRRSAAGLTQKQIAEQLPNLNAFRRNAVTTNLRALRQVLDDTRFSGANETETQQRQDMVKDLRAQLELTQAALNAQGLYNTPVIRDVATRPVATSFVVGGLGTMALAGILRPRPGQPEKFYHKVFRILGIAGLVAAVGGAAHGIIDYFRGEQPALPSVPLQDFRGTMAPNSQRIFVLPASVAVRMDGLTTELTDAVQTITHGGITIERRPNNLVQISVAQNAAVGERTLHLRNGQQTQTVQLRVVVPPAQPPAQR